MSDEAKAAEEIAKTTGKAIDAGREFGSFIAKCIGGSVETAAAIVEDRLKYSRWERRVRLAQRADQFLRERGLTDPTRAVPLNVAVPLLQAGSLEDDDFLQDIWANLLVNAADADSGVSVRRVYMSILDDLGSLEIRILEAIYSTVSAVGEAIYWTRYLPDRAVLEKPPKDNLLPTPEVRLALGNLHRLGCIESAMAWQGGGTALAAAYKTVLGEAFYNACSRKRVAG